MAIQCLLPSSSPALVGCVFHDGFVVAHLYVNWTNPKASLCRCSSFTFHGNNGRDILTHLCKSWRHKFHISSLFILMSLLYSGGCVFPKMGFECGSPCLLLMAFSWNGEDQANFTSNDVSMAILMCFLSYLPPLTYYWK